MSKKPAARRPHAVPAPSNWLAVAELPRAVTEAGLFAVAVPSLLAMIPRGDGHPVIVIPGFLASDASTAPLRGALQVAGYDARGWGLGHNTGPGNSGADGDRLAKLVENVSKETGKRVSLVGWSLGGIMARLIASKHPARVRQVITLGSPFAGSPKATNAWRLYEQMSRTRVDEPGQRAALTRLQAPLPMPSTAIYTRSDGICAWRICRGSRGACSENIEVRGSHCGLGVNASVFLAIADRLAQPDGEWSPFVPRGVAAWMFPSSRAS